ncbi:MAG: ATP-binding cassette domain-containing protein [Spirochaetales bacterium]|nr:ATP-binding cassette domain-containing protein [Spirochaetales bacterium]
MLQISIQDLNKTYKTWQRGSSFKEILKSIFKRSFSEVHAVKNLSLDINEGELVGFIGPNGAGKSTTLKILTGVLYPSSGDVSIMGMVPWRDRRRYVQYIGAVFGQKSQLIWDIPPLDSFMMNQAIYGVPDREFKETLDQLSSMLGVEQLMKQPTRRLSLGERMKCEFIMAMLHQPRIVFLDEPTIGLDVIAKETIRQFILDMNKKGVTFILTTHDLADIEFLARRVIVINHGEQIFDDNIEKLQGLFGAKKIITLKTRESNLSFRLPGLRETSRKSDNEIQYELDLDKTRLGDFISTASKQSRIDDMSIEDIPIETVVKVLYEKKE